MRIDTELRGVEDVNRLLQEIAPRQAKNIMRASVHGVANEIRDKARDKAPTDGPPVVLKTAIKSRRERGRPDYIESTVRIGAGRGQANRAFFWRFLEYGTTKMRERPFVGPAVDWYRSAGERVFLETFVAKFEAAIARARKRQAK